MSKATSTPFGPRSRRRRRGMTLVEVIVAMTILGGVLLSMGSFAATMARNTGATRLLASATQLAGERLEQVRYAPRYSAIDSLYVATETNAGGLAGFTRRTFASRVANDTIDYRVVTVEVAHAGMRRTVRKSAIIAPF